APCCIPGAEEPVSASTSPMHHCTLCRMPKSPLSGRPTPAWHYSSRRSPAGPSTVTAVGPDRACHDRTSTAGGGDGDGTQGRGESLWQSRDGSGLRSSPEEETPPVSTR